MKWLLALGLFLFFSEHIIAQDDSCSIDKVMIVLNEIHSIIDSVSQHSSKTGGEYEVFVARFYHIDKNKNDFCFTLGYILNSYEFDLINPDYFIEIDKRIVVFKFSDISYLKLLTKLNLKKISNENDVKVHIIQKLYPINAGFITYDPCGITFCLKDCKLQISFHRTTNDIPEELSIYDSYPKGDVKKIDPKDFMNIDWKR